MAEFSDKIWNPRSMISQAFVVVVVSSFVFGWLFVPLWLFFTLPQHIPYWLKHFDWLVDPVNNLTGVATILTALIWWQFGGRASIRYAPGAHGDLLWKGFAWAELNAYLCMVLWAVAGEGIFRGRDGPSPQPILMALYGGLMGPIFGSIVSIFVGPLFVWMLESIVRKFETRAPAIVQAKS